MGGSLHLDDEELMIAIYEKSDGNTVRDIIAGIDIPPNRCHALLRKWINKGLYRSAGELDLGSLTESGVREAERRVAARGDPKSSMQRFLATIVQRALGWSEVTHVIVSITKAKENDDLLGHVRIVFSDESKISHVFNSSQIRLMQPPSLLIDALQRKAEYGRKGFLWELKAQP